MASYTRRAHSGGNGPALRQPRTAQSRAGHSAQEGPYTPQESRSRHASHKASNSHRAPNRKKKNTGKGKHRVLKWVLGIFFSLIGLGLLAGIAVFAYLYTTTEVPQPEKFALAEKTTVYYADGTTAIGSYAEQNREIISCEGLPDYIGNAIVASENRTFYTDKGLDLKGIARAFINNVTKGTRQGGSTITQQYAERYYMGETTSYVGKAREAIMAIKIAQTESKDEVLCNYMNTIYLGRNSYGIQAAAKAYFNKDAKDLTLSEAAMIAGIIPSPSTWAPADNADMAKSRFKRVLNIMQEDGYITAKQHTDAKFPQTAAVAQQNEYAGPNGYLLDMVRRAAAGLPQAEGTGFLPAGQAKQSDPPGRLQSTAKDPTSKKKHPLRVLLAVLVLLALAAFGVAWYLTGGYLAALPQRLKNLHLPEWVTLWQAHEPKPGARLI